jgi:hypothetical protein
MREMMVTPLVAQNDTNCASAIDGRTTRQSGYLTSQAIRKRIEKCFGWPMTIRWFAQESVHWARKAGLQFVLTLAAYNLIRIRNLDGLSC